MRQSGWMAAALLAGLAGCGGGGAQGPIGSACLASERSAANRHICSCIQRTADATLSRSDQVRAAKFFKDPDLAQKTRQSGNHGEFWRRYRAFGTAAEANCSGL